MKMSERISERKPDFIMPPEMGLMPRMGERRWPHIEDLLCEQKIIFLNKENLTLFEGYKARVKLIDGVANHSEIHIVLTGFSPKSAQALYDKLKAMKKEEICGDNTSTIHNQKSK
jgi:hypothetical protein